MVKDGLTSMNTTCLPCIPWVAARETVTSLREISPVITEWFVLRLWYTPVPIPLKNRVLESLTVLAIPTNTPVVPSPTLTVDRPIKSSLIFATNNCCWSVRVVPAPAPVSKDIIPSPFPGEYVTTSPVLKLCCGI